MSDTTAVTIATTVAAITAIALGYAAARVHDLRARVHIQQHTIELLRREEYAADEIGTTEQRKRRVLPEGWSVIDGGRGALVLLAPVAALIRRHRHAVASGLVGAGVAAIVAGALLAHGAPPPHHALTGPMPPFPTLLPPRSTATASPLATPPRRTPRRSMPPPVLLPIRPRRSATAAPTTVIPAGPPPPQGSPATPAPSTAPPHTPTPAPTPPAHTTQAPACPIGLSLRVLRIGVTVCL